MKKQPALAENGAILTAANTHAAASLLRVERERLFLLRDRGFPGFAASGRVYLPTLRDAVMQWNPDPEKDERLAATALWWKIRFWGWMDRQGLPGVPKGWKGQGESIGKK